MMSPQYSLLSIVLAIALIAGVSDALRPQKIIGGERAEIGEFPYIVSLRKNGKHTCGGAIIDERHVLTAVHCISSLSPPFKNTVVVTGSVDIHSGEPHDIMGIAYDNRYNASMVDSPYDIALITLRKNITFNDNQRSVPLPDEPHPRGVNAIMAGWGSTTVRGAEKPTYLTKFNSRILSYDKCLDLVADKNEIHKGYHVCTSSPRGIGNCDGDSGGPLVYNGHLIGIYSFGTTRCAVGRPGVYINVFRSLRWIRAVMAYTYSLEERDIIIIDLCEVVVKMIVDTIRNGTSSL